MIATAEEETSFFTWPSSQLNVFYTAAVKGALTKTLQMGRVIILAFSVFVGHDHLYHVGSGWERGFRLCHLAHFIPPHVSLKEAIHFAYGACFSIQLIQPIHPIKVMMTL